MKTCVWNKSCFAYEKGKKINVVNIAEVIQENQQQHSLDHDYDPTFMSNFLDVAQYRFNSHCRCLSSQLRTSMYRVSNVLYD